MAINKVVYGDQTLIDLTSDTATAEDVVEGKTFHDASGQQRTGTGTGGGVVDVEVNGTSVVDPTTKIAEVISYEEVTESKYESIPVAERESNGVAYFIKDLNNSNVQGYPPLIYSDEEREIGVWRDGKPLYQKTAYISNISISANSSTNVNISDHFSDVDNVVNFECCDENGNAIFPNVMVNSGLSPYSIGVTIDKSTDHITFTRGSGSSATISVYLTVQYTKTTDTAGSGTWNGQGGIAHHYSTNETVIGTWIDGSTLYEKSFNLPSAITINNASWTSTGVTIPDIKNVVDGELNRNGSQKFACSFSLSNSEIRIQTYYNGAQCNTDSVVTVRYTKITD